MPFMWIIISRSFEMLVVSSIDSPYDRHLDDRMRSGQRHEDDDNENGVNRSTKRNKNRNRSTSKTRRRNRQTTTLQNEYEDGLSPLVGTSHENQNGEKLKIGKPFYHSQYVHDLTTIPTSSQNKKKKKRKRQDENIKYTNKKEYEIKKVAGITYSIPKMKMDHDDNGRRTTKDSILLTARVLILAKLDQLIWIQTIEEKEKEAADTFWKL